MHPDDSSTTAALEELDALFAEVDARIDALGFTCRQDGACCRFSESGIRLYVTWLEARRLIGTADDILVSDDCPFQEGALCTRRDERSLGCRIYGCDPALDARLSEIYETFHARIVALHDKYGLPYEYRDIREWARIFSSSPP